MPVTVSTAKEVVAVLSKGDDKDNDDDGVEWCILVLWCVEIEATDDDDEHDEMEASQNMKRMATNMEHETVAINLILA